MRGEWRCRILAMIGKASRERLAPGVHPVRHPSCRARLCQLRSSAFFDRQSAMNCMSRSAKPALIVLTALASLAVACWSLDQSLAQQPRAGAQKGPGGPKGGGSAPGAQGNNAQGGDSEGGGRSPAQPHIVRARQLINQAQDFDGAM